MDRYKRIFVALVVVASLGLVEVGPASADSLAQTKAKQQAAHAKRADLAKKIDTLQASDSDLQKAVSDLDSEVQTQEAATADAKQAADAAQAKLDSTQTQLDALNNHISNLKAAIVARAVDDYTNNNQSDALTQFAGTGDMNEASRKVAVLDGLSNSDDNVADTLRASKQDQQRLYDLQKKEQELADSKRAALQSALDQVTADRDEKKRLQDAVQARIDDYQQEADAVASQESSLSNLIRQSSSADNGTFPVSAHGLIRPVNGPITSPFGYRWGRLHAGIDFGVPIGTPIHAAKDGKVVFAGVMNGYGNVIVIDHGGGFATLYAHQSQLASSVGQLVSQGQVIGYSGNTGHSTGPHVHFETRVNGTPVDPMQFL